MSEPTDAEVWAVACRVCTPAELEVLRVRERLAGEGREHGYRSVAQELGLGWTTVRDRTKRAEDRIRREMGAS